MWVNKTDYDTTFSKILDTDSTFNLYYNKNIDLNKQLLKNTYEQEQKKYNREIRSPLDEISNINIENKEKSIINEDLYKSDNKLSSNHRVFIDSTPNKNYKTQYNNKIDISKLNKSSIMNKTGK